MGFLFSKMYELYQSMYNIEPTRILLLGLDGAGKTSILYKLKLNENIVTIPTIGFNVETITPLKGINFVVWDIGGQYRLRDLWKYYYENVKGLVYVVDSNDTSRLDESSEQLISILKENSMRNVPVVVIANKQDLPLAMSVSDLTDKLGLNKLPNTNKWHIQGACATTGDGIWESMKAMADLIKENQINIQQTL